MLNCMLDGNIIFAEEYIGFNDEKAGDKIAKLKQYQNEGRLTCCDENCKAPIVFCHGPVMGSYFRHQKGYGEGCEYNTYAAKREGFNKLKILLYRHLWNMGFDIRVDSRILEHHWTDLAVTFPNGKIVAIELTDRHSGGMDWVILHNKYAELGIADIWIIQEEASNSEAYFDMYVTDMLQYNEDGQGYAIYFDTESEIFTVRAPIGFQPKYYDLIKSRFISVELSCEDISINENGKLIGKYIYEYEKEQKSIRSQYTIAENNRDEEERIKAEQRQKLADQQRAIQEDNQRILQRLSEQQAKRRAEEHDAAIQMALEEVRRKEDTKKAKDEEYRNDVIPKLKMILEQNGIEVENDKFDRFLHAHNNWLRNSYDMGNQDNIMVAKYRKS